VRKKSTETLTGSIPFNRLQPPWGLEPDPGKCEEKLFLKAEGVTSIEEWPE
jgi:hypothetical protein